MLGSRALTRRARRLATLLVVAALATALGAAPAVAGGKPMPAGGKPTPASVRSSDGTAAW
jgi:hypothetical protein